MSDIAIHVENLGKRYRLGEFSAHRTAARMFRNWLARPAARLLGRPTAADGTSPASNGSEEYFWALRDISFDVHRGEVVGIIGRNGAGKSTLLKILSRITEPTTGHAEIHGRVGSLLEVGTGFHPELTGRENIFLNGAILGMSHADIRSRFDEIVEFSGVEKFLDTAVKHYSSGMRVRLAFAVAAHLDPEILIIDEVLAVGDAEFQNKCLGKMQQVSSRGRTVLFVSHNLAAIQRLCGRGVVLESGAVAFDCDAADAVSKYLERHTSSSMRYLASEAAHRSDTANLFAVTVHGPRGEEIATLESGRPVGIRFHYRTLRPRSRVDCAVGVYNSLGQKLLHLSSSCQHAAATGTDVACDTRSVPAGDGAVICDIPSLTLAPGRYYLNIYMGCDGEEIAYVQGALSLTVTEPASPKYGWGSPARTSLFVVAHQWRYRPGAGAWTRR